MARKVGEELSLYKVYSICGKFNSVDALVGQAGMKEFAGSFKLPLSRPSSSCRLNSPNKKSSFITNK